MEEKCARKLELPLLVGRLVYSFSFQLAAEFAVFSSGLAQKGNSNVLAHFSSIRVFTVFYLHPVSFRPLQFYFPLTAFYPNPSRES